MNTLPGIRVTASGPSLAAQALELIFMAKKDGRAGDWMFVHSGRKFWPLDPRPNEVFIADIAHGLGYLCRYNGQCRRFLSVAEHSYFCSFEGPEETALERLMHDAAEAYIGDMIRPLKYQPILGDIYQEIEDRLMQVIAHRFGLQYPFPPDVRAADEAVCTAEMSQNIAAADKGTLHDSRRIADIKLYNWRAEIAEGMFLSRFMELAGQRGNLIF